MRPRAVVAIAAAASLGSCALGGPEVTPLRGPQPESVLIAPSLAPELRSGLARALAARGYRVTGAEVGGELLRDVQVADWRQPTAAELQRIAQTSTCASLLVVVAERFEADGLRPLQGAEYELEWRLLALPDGALLWRHGTSGRYRRPPPPAFDPTVRPDEDRPPLPFGSTRPRDFGSAEELVIALHRDAMLRLPER